MLLLGNSYILNNAISLKLTFAEHLLITEGHPGPALLGDKCKSSLISLCSLFPFNISEDYGFETRFGETEPASDFFLLVRRSSIGAQMIAGRSPVAELSPALKNHEFWQRLSALFREWISPGTFLYENIGSFWLEFDYHNGAYDPVPNLFFQIDDNAGHSGSHAHDSKMSGILDEIYHLLFGIDFPEQILVIMSHCLNRLPPKAILFQTGFMVPRKTEAVRLVISRIMPYQLIEFLRNTGWCGNFSETKFLLDKYAPLFEYCFFDLTIGESLLPVLGTEFFFMTQKQPQWEPGWNKVFDKLEANSLLTSEKREALLNFCGKTMGRQVIPLTYYHGINHLKIVSKPGQKPECKGYFGTMIKSPVDLKTMKQ